MIDLTKYSFTSDSSVLLLVTPKFTQQKYYLSMPKPVKYTKVKVIKITQTQDETLRKLKKYNINVANFIRNAISEKIKKEYQNLIPKQKKSNCPF